MMPTTMWSCTTPNTGISRCSAVSERRNERLKTTRTVHPSVNRLCIPDSRLTRLQGAGISIICTTSVSTFYTPQRPAFFLGDNIHMDLHRSNLFLKLFMNGLRDKRELMTQYRTSIQVVAQTLPRWRLRSF